MLPCDENQPLPLPRGDAPDLAISYNLTAQLYADLRALSERAARYEETLRLQKSNNESLKFQLAQTRAALQKMTTNYEGLRAREKAWKKEKASLEQKIKNDKREYAQKIKSEKSELEQELRKIKNFHSYKLGQCIVEAEKKWGKALAGPIGHLNFAAKRREEREKQARLRRQKERERALIAANVAEEDLVFAAPKGEKLKIAAIMDDFTRECYAPDCELLELEPEKWEKQLKKFKPDLVFIESAWQGKDGAWNLKISVFSEILKDLILYCRGKHIPTLFWNKEDPAHYATFLPVAKAVDYVFTTDIDRIAHYKRDVGHDRVYLLPFAAQPRTHNPIEKYERKPGFCFAGSYYLRYPERQRDFAAVMDAALAVSQIEIYDRNFGKDHPHYMFPDHYREFIIGNLPYAEIDRAYKGYEFGVNMNSVKQSQSMFARRVYELAASNTLVLSNFSRGLRNFFGDLVVSSDNRGELTRRIAPFFEDPNLYRRQRLAALRHVFSLHTYADRLAYIRLKIWKTGVVAPVKIALIASCRDLEQAERAIRYFESQTWPNKELIIAGLPRPENIAARENIKWSTEKDFKSLILDSNADFIGVMDPAHYYGPNYLTDLALAAKYSGASGFGKATRYAMRGGELLLENDGRQYRVGSTFPLYASVIRKNKINELLKCLESGAEYAEGLGLDEFNFVENGAGAEIETLEPALDLTIADKGVDYLNRIIPVAEQAKPAEEATVYDEELPNFTSADLAKAFRSRDNVKIVEKGGVLAVQSTLAAGKFIYLRGPIFPREEINFVLNSTAVIDAGGRLGMKFAFIFLDADNEKISHALVRPGKNVLAIPNECASIRISLRIEGSGSGWIKQIIFGDASEDPACILCRGETLIVAKQYPAYDDLYKYGFLHSRLRKYKEDGRAFDMLRVRKAATRYSEFEDIDVATCDLEELERTLDSGQIRTVAVHLLDQQMWKCLKKYNDRIKIVIWIHGAEIQNWKRREFEFARMSEEEIEYAKRRSDDFMRLWREIFETEADNLEFVFVSNKLREECLEDLGIESIARKNHIIHNFIDQKIFKYKEKGADQRFKIISIRPYTSLKYGNDLTVAAILELSRREGFDKYRFNIIGDGPLFDETVAPLKELENVRIEKQFLTQQEMAKKYDEYGIALTPTRWDSQGVSRDEAMCCGLAPISNAVAAVPEFVDESCGFLAPPEDHLKLADAIEKMAFEEKLFLKMSARAAQRVCQQSGYKQTIAREIEILFGGNQ